MSIHSEQRLTRVGWSLVCLVCVVMSGCELDRPNFQMNSNSRSPFFGIDVLPRRRSTSLVRPRSNDSVVVAESGESRVNRVLGVGQYLARNTKWNESNVRTVVLPLTRTDPDQPMDRGPVELLP